MCGKTTVLRDLVRRISTGIEKIEFKGVLNIYLNNDDNGLDRFFKIYEESLEIFSKEVQENSLNLFKI